MFNKLKLRKAPLSLSSVSNVIKTSGITDLSPSHLNPKQLNVSTITQLGLPLDSIVAVAYDPVQSLLAVSTKNNEVRVYGQHMVEVVFEFKSSSPITTLKFVKGVYLVCVQPISDNIIVLSLHTKEILSTYLPPGHINSVETDPSLDWLIIGSTNGSLLFYDVDRFALTPFRIDNLQKSILPKHKMSAVNSIEWNPRDIGTILISYSHCAVIYSLTTGTIKSSFVYNLSKGDKGFEYSLHVANGGKKKLFGSSKEVIPEILESHFHPNGLHVLTVHKDNTLVFWDANDGTLLEARTIFEINLHLPSGGVPLEPPTEGFIPIKTVNWIAGQDPELTQLVISGGDMAQENILHILDFGFTLKYSMTSHEKQGEFYSQPSQGQRIIPIKFYGIIPNQDPNNSSTSQIEKEFVEKIIPICGDAQPYFHGNHNPSYLMLLSNIGALYIIEYSTSIGATNIGGTDLSGLVLPPSLAFVNPPVIYSSVQSVRRTHWYGIVASRTSTGAGAKQTLLLKGGSAVHNNSIPKPMGNDDNLRSVLITGHENGQVRFLDITRGEHQEPESILQVSFKETLYDNGDSRTLKIIEVSCGFENREMLVGLANGNVIICKFGKSPRSSQGNFNGQDYSDCPTLHKNNDAKIINIKHRILGKFAAASTFLPVHLLQIENYQEISCLKMSNIGFAAIAYKSGKLVVCDITRGPAIILNEDSLSQFVSSGPGNIYATTMEFSIMEYGQDGYSSILLLVGTNGGGNLLMFKIVPQGNGGFSVVFADKTVNLNYRILGNEDPVVSKLDQLIPLNSNSGESTVASLEMFQRLSTGILIPGFLITSSNRDIRVLKLPKSKLSHKVIDDSCLRCGIIRVRDKGIVLATLMKTGFIKFSALPSLSDIIDIKLPKDIYGKIKESLESGIATKSDVLVNGEIFVRLSETEFVTLSASHNDHKLKKASKDGPVTDLLFNENALIPPRPSVSALQWAKGLSKYTSPDDLAFLIAGPNRKPAKHPESRLAFNLSPEANPSMSYGAAPTQVPDTNDRGYKEPVRGSKGPSNPYALPTTGFLRGVQTGIESMEETVHGYANGMTEAMNDSVESQKKAFYSSAVKSKLGF